MTAVDENIQKPRKWGALILFSSSATLLCCAIPIVFVSLGMGAVIASVYGEYLPWLRWFGMNSGITFAVTAGILLLAGWALFKPGRACPTDPELAQICNKTHLWNRRFYWASILVWCIGAYAAFIMPLFI